MADDYTTPADDVARMLTTAVGPTDDQATDAAAWLRTYAVGAAFMELVKERQDVARENMTGILGRGGSKKVGGLGSATVTDPTRAAILTDREAFAAWLEEREPETVERRQRINTAVIAKAVDNDPGLIDQLVELIGEDVVDEDIHIDDETVERVANEYAAPDPGRPEVIRLGKIADEDGALIPGIEVTEKSDPHLQVRLDGDGVARIRSIIEDNLTPAIGGGDDDAQENA